jgi:hypothetical protein
MFKIIGADQKEYGPISTAQIRQWITEGRLSANSRAKREDGGDWQTLSAFEEFADIFQPAGAPPSSTFASAPGMGTANPIPTASRDMALKAVKGPAIALIIVAALGIVCSLWRLVVLLAGTGLATQGMDQLPPQMRQMLVASQGTVGIVTVLVGVLIYVFVLYAALKMMRLQNHTLAFIACILAFLPCGYCCCILGIPFGIWGLVVLNKPEVKSQFTN